MHDVTLLNLNMLYMRYFDNVDRELHVPLGPLYCTSALEGKGYSVDFRDYQWNTYDNPFDADNIVDFLMDPAEIVGVSCMANLLPFTILALKRFRECYPDRKVILGGVGPSSVERRVLKEFPWIDIIVKGEAERTFPRLLKALKEDSPLSGIDGIIYRDGGEIVDNSPQERITDLDKIPFPAFHKVDLNNYEGYGMITSRGCPYPCTFCSVAPIWGRKSYFRSNENIIEEMCYLNEKAGVDLFLFQDEFFVSSKERVLSFCRALRESGLRVDWKAFGRVNLTDRETMEVMAESGCVEIRYGIESGSDRILEKTKKGFSSEEAVEAVSEAVKIFDRVDCFFIWGFPFETMDDFHKSVFQMVSFRMMGARILPSLLCLLPQTVIYQECAKGNGLEFCPDLLPEYMFTGHEVCHSVKVSVLEEHRSIFDFISRYPDIFPGFFHIDSRENILSKLKVLQEFGFYPKEKNQGTDSCGAHSPKITTDATRHLTCVQES